MLVFKSLLSCCHIGLAQQKQRGGFKVFAEEAVCLASIPRLQAVLLSFSLICTLASGWQFIMSLFDSEATCAEIAIDVQVP